MDGVRVRGKQKPDWRGSVTLRDGANTSQESRDVGEGWGAGGYLGVRDQPAGL